MSDEDQKSIVQYIHEVSSQGDLALSWKLLENTFGFTRQAMQAKSSIKSAFQHAKTIKKSNGAAPRRLSSLSSEQLIKKVEELEHEVALLKSRETEWKARWQRIAYHIRQKGMQVAEIDSPAPDGAKLPDVKRTEEVIRYLDDEIPPPIT